MENFKYIDGGSVTSPLGFTANGICAGVKPSNTTKKDLALIYCEKVCNSAAIFTKNLVKSDTIYVTKKHLENGTAQAVVVNSGNANACNPDGYEKAEKMCKLAASALGVDENDVIVASTGVIGQPLPIEPIEKGIENLKGTLSKDGGTFAAEAIMTTDTVKKEWAVETVLGGKKVTIGGIAKGSGMIHINMGTTLSFVTTDAAISAEMLKSALKEAADVSYNMVSIDGDTSTNDTLAIMASGLAGNAEITEKNEDYKTFVKVLTDAFKKVAKKLAADGEGATKLLICKVSGAKDEQDAKTIAKSIICSSLVKAAMFGADANCGRILCAVGYSGAEVDVHKIDVSYKSAKGEILVCKDGNGLAFDEDKAKEILLEKEIEIIVSLRDGNGIAEAYGCDLTYDYVKINGDYRT
ncbi:MAG: bifunctional glutamate N-acetyltransferase/amino-acid acetyltransferase ArgJ [Ruminococcus bromii]|nr:bifunctional glutamate N-acetyltransferase/amino-acid acetyltransferase ArgJ [Ruminococcus bromii]